MGQPAKLSDADRGRAVELAHRIVARVAKDEGEATGALAAGVAGELELLQLAQALLQDERRVALLKGLLAEMIETTISE